MCRFADLGNLKIKIDFLITKHLHIAAPSALVSKTFVKLVICIILSMQLQSTYAQSREAYLSEEIAPRTFEKKEWKKAIEGIDFTEIKQEAERKKQEARNLETSGWWSGVFKILLIAAGVLVVVLLLAHFLGGGNLFRPKSQKVKPRVVPIDIANVEDHLEQADMDGFIQQATSKGDYNLAIRLYYLAIIKELSVAKQIKWKKEKTNRDYIREMGASSSFSDFRDCTQTYERVWYGDSQLDRITYSHLVTKFKSLLHAAKSQAALVEA